MPSNHYISVWCAFRNKFLGPYLPPNALSVFVVHPFKYTMIRHHQQFCKSDIGENSELYKAKVQTYCKSCCDDIWIFRSSCAPLLAWHSGWQVYLPHIDIRML